MKRVASAARRRAAWLASALQLAQVVYIQTPWLYWHFAMGLDAGPALVVRPGPVSAAGVAFRAYPTAVLELFVGRPVDTLVLGGNVVAAAAWFAVRRARRTTRARPEAPPVAS